MSFWKKLFGLEKPVQNETTGVLLMTAYGNEEIAAAEALLRGADIPYRLSDRGAGGVVRTVMGYTMYGTDIFVRPDDLDTAKELLAPVPVDEVESEDENTAPEGEADA